MKIDPKWFCLKRNGHYLSPQLQKSAEIWWIDIHLVLINIYTNLTALCDGQIIESTCSFKCKSNPLNLIEMVILQFQLGVHVSMSCNGYLPFWFSYSVSNINSEHIQWYLLMTSGSKLIWIHSHCDHLSVLACICSL